MIKGYNLMKQAEENKEKYEGRRYKLTNGYMFDFVEKPISEIEILDGKLQSRGCLVYISNNAEFREIQKPPKPVGIVTAVNSGRRIKPNIDPIFWRYHNPAVWFGYFTYADGFINRTNYLEYFNGGWLIEPEEE